MCVYMCVLVCVYMHLHIYTYISIHSNIYVDFHIHTIHYVHNTYAIVYCWFSEPLIIRSKNPVYLNTKDHGYESLSLGLVSL